MPRPRAFDQTDVLEKAMSTFWHKGYHDTSMQDLVDAMGINRFSIYSTFNDKHSLFLLALDHYQQTMVGRMLAVLDRPDASVAEIRRFFERIVAGAQAGPRARYGCLMVNTAAELAADDPEAANKVKDYLDRLQPAFSRALENGRSSGELAAAFDVNAFAIYLTGIVLGLSMYLKLPGAHATIQTYIRTALAPLG